MRCPDAAVGDTGVINIGGTDMTFTKRDRVGLLALLGDPSTEAELATSCTSGVTDMSHLLVGGAESGTSNGVSDLSAFDVDISSWDTGSVTDMFGMFAGASAFNQPLGDWDTSSVEHLDYMFLGASSFNQDLQSWTLPSAGSSTTCTDFAYGASAWLDAHEGMITGKSPPLSVDLVAAGCGGGSASPTSSSPSPTSRFYVHTNGDAVRTSVIVSKSL